MPDLRTYIDANLIIFALNLDDDDERSQKAFDVLEDPDRVIEGGANELVTFERPTKPFYRIPASELRIVSLYDSFN